MPDASKASGRASVVRVGGDGLLDAFERLPSEDRGDAGATVERLRWLQRTGASTPNELVAVAGWLDSTVTQLSR